MADTVTPNYGWLKPEVGASSATWGAKQNGVFDQIDAQVFANQQGIVPVGAVQMYAGGAPPPPNWFFCAGQSLDTTVHATLFAVIGYAWGGSGANFNLPDFTHRLPLGAGPNPLGSTGGGNAGDGTFNYVIATANLPAHAHAITDKTHTHPATQPAHTHPDPGHNHPVTASQDPHSHGLDHIPMTESAGPNGAPGGGWGFNSTRTDAQQPPVHVTLTPAATGLGAAQPAITVTPALSGLTTTQSAGGGAALSIVPPYAALNFIIRYQ